CCPCMRLPKGVPCCSVSRSRASSRRPRRPICRCGSFYRSSLKPCTRSSTNMTSPMHAFSGFLRRFHLVWAKSIYRQLALSFSLAAIFISLLAGSLIYSYERKIQYAQGVQNALDLARSNAYSSISWVLANDLTGLQEVQQGI